MNALKLSIAISLLSAGHTISTAAQPPNLIVNPGNELPLVNANMPGWTLDHGAPWAQGSLNPPAYEGAYYFSAGPEADETLSQDIDLSAYAAQISSGAISFALSGRIRGDSASSVVQAIIAVHSFDQFGTRVADYTYGLLPTPDDWGLVSAVFQVPLTTTSLQFSLASHRISGLTNDAYFDALSLTPVPEPATAALALSGLAFVLARIRRATRVASDRSLFTV